MLILLQSAAGGHGYTLAPKSAEQLKRIREDMRKNGCEKPPKDVFFQSEEDLVSSLEELIPNRILNDVMDGFPSTCRMDDWTVRHLFGYCVD